MLASAPTAMVANTERVILAMQQIPPNTGTINPGRLSYAGATIPRASGILSPGRQARFTNPPYVVRLSSGSPSQTSGQSGHAAPHPLGGSGGGDDRVRGSGAPGSKEKRFVEQIVGALLNPGFNESTRRDQSIFVAPFDQILEPYLACPYPLNCIGPFARLTAENLESFVNIGQLISLLRNHVDGDLLRIFESALQDEEAYAKIRSLIRKALHQIGSHAYTFEWRDNITFDNIDTLLEGLAAYRGSNRLIAERLSPKIEQKLNSGRPVFILDLGSGVGGTSSELFLYLRELVEQGKIPENYMQNINLVLYDISQPQLEVASERLREQFGVSHVICKNGPFDDIGTVLSEFADKIDIVVSGAAICHALDKRTFFAELHGLMRASSVMSFWDPAFSIYQAQLIKVTNPGMARIEYHTSSDRVINVPKGELLSPQDIQALSGQTYTTTVYLPVGEIRLLAVALMHMYLGQMGYSASTIGAEQTRQLKQKMLDDLLTDSGGSTGFNLLEWYERNLSIFELDGTSWTPYDLIEAVSDADEYQRAINGAGFINYQRLQNGAAELSPDNEASVNSIFAYFYFEKK